MSYKFWYIVKNKKNDFKINVYFRLPHILSTFNLFRKYMPVNIFLIDIY